MRLESLPLTGTGKIDRQKLRSLTARSLHRSRSPKKLTTRIERLVLNIFSELLAVESVSVHDNFFELGGHSLLAIQVINRLREALGKEIPIQAVFEAANIAALAENIEKLIGEGSTPNFPAIIPVPRTEPIAVSFNQEQIWRIHRIFRHSSFFNLAYVYHLSGNLNIEVLENSLKAIFHKHEALRTLFTEKHQMPVQIIDSIIEFKMAVIDLRSLPAGEMEERAAELTLKEKTHNFDLAKGPLLIPKLVRLTEEDSLLLVTLHHLIGDEWSMNVFSRELTYFYEAFTQKQSPFSADHQIQFADFAHLERKYIGSEFFQSQLDYWKDKLAQPLPMLRFNKKQQSSRRPSFNVSQTPIELNDALFEKVKSFARTEQCTVFIVLVAALSLSIYMCTGNVDIRIGTLVANRRRPEFEGAFGHFINTVIIRTHIYPKRSLQEHLTHVKSVTLEAYSNQELPFEYLVRVLETEMKLDRESLIQIFIDYQLLSVERKQTSGITIAPLHFGMARIPMISTVTAFDMVLRMRESSTQLTGSVNYKTNAFRVSNIAMLIQWLETILRMMIVKPESIISEVLTTPVSEVL